MMVSHQLPRGNKIVYKMKSKVTNNLFIKKQLMCYKRAWQNQIGLLCIVEEEEEETLIY